MKLKFLSLIAIFCLTCTVVYGQNEFAGKWQTDQAAAAQAAQGQPATAEGRGRGGGGQAVVLDLKVEGNKLSGTVNEIGNGDPLTITEGTITGKMFTFKTVRPLNGGNTVTVTWNGEMTDDNTISITRVLPQRGGGAGGAGGRGGGFGGGAPVDPARGGGAPGAGGGRGGRGGGALIFHRPK